MKKLLFVLFAVVLTICACSLYVCAEESEVLATDVSETVSDAISEASEDSDALDTEVELEYYGFGEEGFMRNLKYMGLGMLGIFAVVGVVILITYILNVSTGKKKE